MRLTRDRRRDGGRWILIILEFSQKLLISSIGLSSETEVTSEKQGTIRDPETTRPASKETTTEIPNDHSF